MPDENVVRTPQDIATVQLAEARGVLAWVEALTDALTEAATATDGLLSCCRWHEQPYHEARLLFLLEIEREQASGRVGELEEWATRLRATIAQFEQSAGTPREPAPDLIATPAGRALYQRHLPSPPEEQSD
jgi:hypothetical protein